MNIKILKSFISASLLSANVYSMEVEESPTQSMDVETHPVEQPKETKKRDRHRYEGGIIRQSQRLIELAQQNYKFTINDLPDELIHHIFSYLDIDASLDARVANVKFLRCSLRSWNGNKREYDIRWLWFYPHLTEITGPFEDFSTWNKGFGNWLSNDSSLTTLDIRNSKIGPASTKIIINALWDNNTLTSLNLENNNIGVTGTRLIFKLLEKNTTLRSLSLDNNQINIKPVQKNLVNALSTNTTLTKLDLGWNVFKMTDMEKFVEAINKNTSLLTLGLDGIGLGTIYCGLAIDKILEKNITLTSLSARYNNIRRDHSKLIAQALKKNSTLKKLYLGCNYLQFFVEENSVHAEIFLTLKNNTSLTVLDLERNYINSHCSQKIAEILEMNTTLKKLYLDQSYITDEGAQVIAQALGNNTSLKKLYLSKNPISLEVQEQLKEQWGDRIYVDLDADQDNG